MNVYLAGSSDSHVEELLHACGARTKVVSADDLVSLTLPSAAQPDVLVIDLRDRGALPSAIAHLTRQHPLTGVVVLASHLDPSLMLEAMRAGVQELVPEPLTARELKAAMERVAAKRPQPAPGQVFAFVGGKGGIGTTTLAVNVAAVLASQEPSSTLLIDLHVAYGDATVFLGIEPRFSVADALENVHRIDESFLRGLVGHTKIGLDVLASSDRAAISSVDARAVRGLIECASRHYRYVVLDVPRSDTTILDSLDLSTRIIVVANQELATVRSASRMASALRHRYDSQRVSVVVSRYDQVAEIRQKDIERVIGGPVAEMFPSNYRLALEAVNRGRPLVLDNHNKLAHAYGSFARKLLGAPGSNGTAPTAEAAPRGRSSGLLGRLSIRP
jgi:pilus assembly protein CpaE